MNKLPIAIVAVVVVLAFVGGYFTGLMNSAGNFTLNVTNKTSSSDDSGTSTYKAPTTSTKNTNYYKNTATTADTSTDASTPVETNPTPETPATCSTAT